MSTRRKCLPPEAEPKGLVPSSPSEDYLTVLAGQRQWIATTNFAGCPGRPPDSFANSAVLNYLGKVPDALGWPIDPCFPVQIDPKAEQFEQVVARCRSATIRRSPSPVPAAGTAGIPGPA